MPELWINWLRILSGEMFYSSMQNKEEIQNRLFQMERDYNVTIPYAVESGSRVYGFDSSDSDWDIRGIYIQPTENYLKIHHYASDVVEQLNFMEDDKDYV